MRYSGLVLDHVKNPRNVGEIAGTTARARVRSIEDGDMLQLHLKIENSIIMDAKFKVYGCGAAIAAGSILTEMVIGKSVQEIATIKNETLSSVMGGLPPEKIHCSVLAEQAIREAISAWERGE